MKTVKKFSLLIISAISVVALSSCSSGGSTSTSGPLDLTGSFNGTVTFVDTQLTEDGDPFIANSGVFGAFLTIAQDQPVTLAGDTEADLVLQVTSPQGCVAILNVEGATVNGVSQTISTVSDDDDEGSFVGSATNTTISGSFNLGAGGLLCGIIGGRAEFTRI